MNRIILIGNGFDLAHGLPTSYKNFIDNFWNKTIKKIRDSRSRYEDDYISLSTSTQTLAHVISHNSDYTYMGLLAQIKSFRESSIAYNAKISFNFKNIFFQSISKHCGLKNWVDIENLYYKALNDTINPLNNSFDNDKLYSLNHEFLAIERLLENYLSEVEEKEINVLQSIKEKIYSSVELKDLSNAYQEKFFDEIEEKAILINTNPNARTIIGIDKDRYEDSYFDYDDINYFSSELLAKNDKKDYIFKQIHYKSIPSFYTHPDDIVFLNFNYTHTINNYISKKSGFDTIYIHGELMNKENSMIFGYGDEIGEDYKKIENLNENEYLKNVKSIRYFETDNYKKLLNFVESKPYQIFIFGHSCGNSDRTLLNTLFEHENCVSIKPFYHKKSDIEDNYNDIVRNISRNFTNKPSMRDKVVNKMYCEPLI